MKVCLCALSDFPGQSEKILQYQSFFESRHIRCEILPMCLSPAGFRQKAEQFNEAAASHAFDWLVDVSGGDLANGVLEYLDYEVWKNSPTKYAGFSDCSVICNALYAKTGKPSLLAGIWLQNDLDAFACMLETADPDPVIEGAPLEADQMVLGGNLRCFLKLAGTPYFPDCRGSQIVLESSSMKPNAFISLLAQLKQMGVLDQAAGLMFGRFNAIERQYPNLECFVGQVLHMLDIHLPVRWCPAIGHIENGQSIWIGRKGNLNVE